MIVNKTGGHKDKQIGTFHILGLALEESADQRQFAQERNFVNTNDGLVLNHSAQDQSFTIADVYKGLQSTLTDDRFPDGVVLIDFFGKMPYNDS